MKIFIGVVAILLLSHCGIKESSTEKNKQHTENIDLSDSMIVLKYYDAYNQKDYGQLDEILHKDIKLYDSDKLITKSKEEFIDLVEWGEVFNSNNKLEELVEEKGKWKSTESQQSDSTISKNTKNRR